MADSSGYDSMTVELLRRELRQRKLPVKGRKFEMVRLFVCLFRSTPFRYPAHLISLSLLF